MKLTRVLAMAAVASVPIGALPMITAAPAQAGPLCPPLPANVQMTPRLQQLHEQCLQAERNQNYCGLASGCTPGDPCVVGSPSEIAACNDARLSGQQPRY